MLFEAWDLCILGHKKCCRTHEFLFVNATAPLLNPESVFPSHPDDNYPDK